MTRAAADNGYHNAPTWAPPDAGYTLAWIITCHFVTWTAPPCFNTYTPSQPEFTLSAASFAHTFMLVTSIRKLADWRFGIEGVESLVLSPMGVSG